MSFPEHQARPHPEGELPPELAEFLRGQDYACLTQAIDKGTAFVLKLPHVEIDSVRGTVPIQFRQELYDHPLAPVIRIVITIYDQLTAPLAVETFINVADEQQRGDFAALKGQDKLILLFYNESLTHSLTKVLPYDGRAAANQTLLAAEQILRAIPEERFDFDRAK